VTVLKIGEVIFKQSFETIFVTAFFFSFFIGQK